MGYTTIAKIYICIYMECKHRLLTANDTDHVTETLPVKSNLSSTKVNSVRQRNYTPMVSSRLSKVF